MIHRACGCSPRCESSLPWSDKYYTVRVVSRAIPFKITIEDNKLTMVEIKNTTLIKSKLSESRNSAHQSQTTFASRCNATREQISKKIYACMKKLKNHTLEKSPSVFVYPYGTVSHVCNIMLGFSSIFIHFRSIPTDKLHSFWEIYLQDDKDFIVIQKYCLNNSSS